jgi:hypothetical protein
MLPGYFIREKYAEDIIRSSTKGKKIFFYLGTCLPAPVSEKKVLKLSSVVPEVLSEGSMPSG